MGIFFCIWLFPFPFTILPIIEKLFAWYNKFWDNLVPFAAKAIFGVNHSMPPGSDTTFYAVQLFLFSLLALLLAAIWSWLDIKNRNHELYWINVYIHFGLAFTMSVYAISKILKYQFPFPGPYYYSRTFGEVSPQELFWNCMGYSYSYNLFTGFAEAACAILLFFRRTATLGALITIAVMANVVMMNFSYDINVKIVSTSILLMSVYLVLPYVTQLYNFFVRHNTSSLAKPRPVIASKKLRVAIMGIETILILSILFGRIDGGLKLQKQFGDKAPKSKLAGAYKTTTYIINKDTIPPLATDSIRWDMLVLFGMKFAELKRMNEQRQFYIFNYDEVNNTFHLKSPEDTSKQFMFKFKRIDPTNILLTGKNESDSLSITIRKMEFELENHKIKIIDDDNLN